MALYSCLLVMVLILWCDWFTAVGFGFSGCLILVLLFGVLYGDIVWWCFSFLICFGFGLGLCCLVTC